MDKEIDILVLFLRKYTKLKFLVSDLLRLEMWTKNDVVPQCDIQQDDISEKLPQKSSKS